MVQRGPFITLFVVTMHLRCQARSKRSGDQCSKAARQGKRLCKTHGDASTGPKTPAGQQRCAEAETIHGRETRKICAKRDAKLREL
jgi:hypothetical protein